VLLLIVAGLSVVTARRGWNGTLRREGRLGIHAPAAAASDRAFAVANKVAAPVVAGAALVSMLFAVLVLVLPVPPAATVVIAVLGVLAVPVLLIAAGVLGERAARTMPVPARRPGPNAACDGCACGGAGCGGLTRTAVPVDAGDDRA
jgi:hypothetical protein